MNLPLVTIITPTYNHAKYIKECIQSAINQTYTYWEMIIVNDGSTDNTLEIIENFLKKDKRLKLFNRKNIGPFRLEETYNFAFERANGKYITILEGDDFWENFKLEVQITAMESNESIVLAWAKAKLVDSNKNLIKILPDSNIFNESVFNNFPPGKILEILYFQNILPAQTLMIRTSALKEIGGFKSLAGLPLIDYPTIIELSLKGIFCYQNEIVGNWRIYSSQVTKTYTVNIYEGLAAAAISHYKKNIDNDFVKKINLKKISRNWNELLIVAYSRSGRYKLIRKDFIGARKDYLKSIFSSGTSRIIWRLRSLVGYLFSLFKLDIEKFAKRIGRTSYSKE